MDRRPTATKAKGQTALELDVSQRAIKEGGMQAEVWVQRVAVDAQGVIGTDVKELGVGAVDASVKAPERLEEPLVVDLNDTREVLGTGVDAGP